MTALAEIHATPELHARIPRSWVAEELSTIALGDKRLNRRLIATAEELAAQPAAPVNQACAD